LSNKNIEKIIEVPEDDEVHEKLENSGIELNTMENQDQLEGAMNSKSVEENPEEFEYIVDVSTNVKKIGTN
jgi:hypothetical protein